LKEEAYRIFKKEKERNCKKAEKQEAGFQKNSKNECVAEKNHQNP